jgi:hypothetical protein
VAQVGATNDSLREVEFKVDTGALHTMLPPQLCEDLGCTCLFVNVS